MLVHRDYAVAAPPGRAGRTYACAGGVLAVIAQYEHGHLLLRLRLVGVDLLGKDLESAAGISEEEISRLVRAARPKRGAAL